MLVPLCKLLKGQISANISQILAVFAGNKNILELVEPPEDEEKGLHVVPMY